MVRILNFILLQLFAIMGFAQSNSSLVATLIHKGEISLFFGIEALVSANRNAEDGDTICLSAGAFNSCGSVEHSLVIKGVRFNPESIYNGQPTIIHGEEIQFNKHYGSDEPTFSKVEGITFLSVVSSDQWGGKTTFSKCKFIGGCELSYTNCVFSNCRFDFLHTYQDQKTEFYNSIINNLYVEYWGEAIFHNCVIGVNDFDWVASSAFYDCFIFFKESGSLQNDNYRHNYTHNCVGFSDTEDVMSQSDIYNTCRVLATSSVADVFETFDEYLPEVNAYYQIKAEQKQNFVYTADGHTEEIGLYGGFFPYNEIPSDPRITEFRVDKKSSPEGLLNVSIQVE